MVIKLLLKYSYSLINAFIVKIHKHYEQILTMLCFLHACRMNTILNDWLQIKIYNCYDVYRFLQSILHALIQILEFWRSYWTLRRRLCIMLTGKTDDRYILQLHAWSLITWNCYWRGKYLFNNLLSFMETIIRKSQYFLSSLYNEHSVWCLNILTVICATFTFKSDWYADVLFILPIFLQGS